MVVVVVGLSGVVVGGCCFLLNLSRHCILSFVFSLSVCGCTGVCVVVGVHDCCALVIVGVFGGFC